MSDFREFLQLTARKNEQLIPTKHKQQQWVALIKDNGKNSQLKELKVISRPVTIAKSQNKNNKDNNNDVLLSTY